MAEIPSTPQWPPGDEIDFDSLVSRALILKRQLLPQHTTLDASDPLVQLIYLVCALGQHAMGRVNHALKQLNPKYATSRRALIALMEIVNKPLLPMIPAQGIAYAKLSSSPVINTVLVEKRTRIVQPNSIDPVYSADEDVSTGSTVSFSLWFHDAFAGTITLMPLPAVINDGAPDAIIIGVPSLMFDSVRIDMSAAHASPGQEYCLDYYNEESGNPDSVTDLTATLEFVVNTYLHVDTVALTSINGIIVRVTCKLTGEYEDVYTTIDGSNIIATTVATLGQTGGNSTVTSDYEIFSEWRPAAFTDSTLGLSKSESISFSMSSVKSVTDSWSESSLYGFAIRLRNTGMGHGALGPITITAISNTSGSYYVNVPVTQGHQSTFTVGQTDGTAFQRIPLSSDPIFEPIDDPAVTIEVGGDTDWSIVSDLSGSSTNSKHAVLHEDVDDGWCVMFGDGILGTIPTIGSTVKLTYRSGSSKPGNINALTQIKTASSSPAVNSWVLPRAIDGYAVPEASDANSARRFRWSVIPQLSLRAESVVTPSEIETALSGGATNRATFTTSDGRKPFTRAMFSTSSVGSRQYRVVVVGNEDDPSGSVSLADTTEAEEWLNGTVVGVQVVGGHGPLNTQAIVRAFSGRQLLPTITITARDTTGMRNAADAAFRSFIKPHSANEDGSWRWEFGGNVPVALIFGALWDALPGRIMVAITISDGTITYALGDSVSLEEFELPVIDPAYDSSVNIVLIEV